MNYYISDLHLLHENVLRFDNRPFETIENMQETIVNNWNRKVTNGDTVYILGDVSMRGKKEDLISLVATLKGRKVLVKGNHDDVSDYRYQQLYYEIVDYKEIHDAVDGQTMIWFCAIIQYLAGRRWEEESFCFMVTHMIVQRISIIRIVLKQ